MTSRTIPGLVLLALLMLAALSALSLAAADDLTFQAIMSPRQAKLFQYPGGAYSVEVMEIVGEKARFFINGEELTKPLAKGEEHKTTDNSTIEVTLVKQQQDTVKFIFFGSGKDPLPTPAESYAVRTIPTQYDYPDNAPAPSPALASLPEVMVTPPQLIETPIAPEEARRPAEESAAEDKEEKEEEEENVIAIEGESETFSIGWMNKLWDWIRGLFS